MIGPMISLPIGIIGNELIQKDVFASTIQNSVAEWNNNLTQLWDWLLLHLEDDAEKIRAFFGLWDARSLYDSIIQMKPQNYYILIETPFAFIAGGRQASVRLAIAKVEGRIYLLCISVIFELFYPFYGKYMDEQQGNVSFIPNVAMSEKYARQQFIEKFILPLIIQTRIQKNEVQD